MTNNQIPPPNFIQFNSPPPIQDDNERLKDILRARGCATCPNCKRELDQGDIAWNNATSEMGSDYSTMICICQKCDTHIFRIQSYYPEIENLEEFCNVLDNPDWWMAYPEQSTLLYRRNPPLHN